MGQYYKYEPVFFDSTAGTFTLAQIQFLNSLVYSWRIKNE